MAGQRGKPVTAAEGADVAEVLAVPARGEHERQREQCGQSHVTPLLMPSDYRPIWAGAGGVITKTGPPQRCDMPGLPSIARWGLLPPLFPEGTPRSARKISTTLSVCDRADGGGPFANRQIRGRPD